MKINRQSIVLLMIYIYLGYGLLYLPFVQLQMQISGRIFIGSSLIMSIEMGLLFIYSLFTLTSNKYRAKTKTLVIVLLFFLAFECFRGLIEYNSSLYETGLFVYNKLFPLLLVLLIYDNSDNLSNLYIHKPLKLILWINIIVIFLQKLTNSILWPYQYDQTGKNIFWAVNTYGLVSENLRVTGISTSGLSGGMLCVILFVFLLSDKIKHKYKLLSINSLLMLVCIIACYWTFTRNIYILLVYVVIYTIVIYRTINRKNAALYGIIMMFITVILYFIVLNMVWGNDSNVGLLNNASSRIRMENWNNIILQIKSSRLHELVIGSMHWQASSQRAVFTDSLYFELMLSIGIVGILLYFGLIYVIHGAIISKRAKYIIPFGALLTSICVYGVVNVPGSDMEALIFVIALLNASGIYEDNSVMVWRNVNERKSCSQYVGI